MLSWACENCGFWQRWFGELPPPGCPVCLDVRNALPEDGWSFATQADLSQRLTCRQWDPLPGVRAFATSPRFGLDSVGWVLTERGIAVEAAPWYDEPALDQLRALGVHTLVASHVHGYGGIAHLQDALSPERVVVGVRDLGWTKAFRVTRPVDDTIDLGDGVTGIVSAGHFDGHLVTHDARLGLLFCGDMLKVDLDEHQRPQALSAHKAYHAQIPLSPGEVRRNREVVEVLDFEHVLTPFEHGPGITTAVVLALFDRLLAQGPTCSPVALSELRPDLPAILS